MIATLPLPASAAEDTDAAVGSFEIVRFEVQGSALLPAQTIDTLLAPFTGKHRQFADVERAVEALQTAYHRRGLKLVQVVLPEQELNGGVVRLQVIETRIGKVIVEGNTVFDQANIRHSLPGLRENETPDLDRISASLKLANESPAKKTVLQLQSADAPGEVDAIVKVADEKAWKVGLTLDNTGNSETGETRLGLLYTRREANARYAGRHRDPRIVADVSDGGRAGGCAGRHVHIPCGNPGLTVNIPFLRSFDDSSAESAIGTI